MSTGLSKKQGESIFDLLSDGTPRTVHQIAAHQNVGLEAVRAGIRWLRIVLAESDDVNIVATPQKNAPWLYSLTGDMEVAQPWVSNRMEDARSRLETMRAVVAVMAGREAKIIRRGLSRIMEDLDDLKSA